MTMFSPPPLLDDVEWLLVRDWFMPPRNGREGFAIGKLYWDRNADHICETLEDEDRRLEEGNPKIPGRSAIPLGRYRLTLYRSPKHGLVPLLNDVPNFKYIEMHGANQAEQLLGCIALGEERTLDGVRSCGPALAVVVEELKRRAIQGRSVFLTIERA